MEEVGSIDISWGGHGANLFTGWTVDEDRFDVFYGDPAPDVFEGTAGGATICKRHIDSVLRDGAPAVSPICHRIPSS